MRILTDCPDALAAWRTGALDWRREPAPSLAGSERVLWDALATGDTPWVGQGPASGPLGFWSHVFVVDDAPESQFDVLRRLLAGGLRLPGPTACVALSGRGFHGHHGRPWSAERGNLHLVVGLEPVALAASRVQDLTMLAAVAVVEAVRTASAGSVQAGIKWVNDLLLRGQKIGGILAATQVQGTHLTGAVLGLGLNVAGAPAVPPTPTVPAVGCLAGAGAQVTLEGALTAVLTALAKRYDELLRHGPDALFQAYRGASLAVGREVCIFEDPLPPRPEGPPWPPVIARGKVLDLLPDLSLLIEGATGPVERGRLAFAEDCVALGVPGVGPRSAAP